MTRNVTAAPPPNDTCAGAVVVPGDGPFPYLTAVITNVGAATTNGDPAVSTNCVINDIYNSVWFSFRPTVSGAYTFSVAYDTATTVPDTAMGVYSSSGPCAGLASIGCSDDEGSLRSAIHATLSAGITYYIVVWATVLPAGPGEDWVQLRVSKPVTPANDTCAGAEIIPASGPFPYFTSTNDITFATIASDPPTPGCYANGRKSVWFRFIPATNGSYFFTTAYDTATTIHETVLTIYSASGNCTGYSQVGCAHVDEDRADITRALTANARYYVVVWDADTNSPTHGETSLQLGVALVDRPAVTTLPAAQISSTNARLRGIVAPNGLSTRTWFEWGLTTNYGTRTTPRLLGVGARPIETNAVINNLVPGTTYNYRIVATNSMGTNFGANATFVWSGTRPQITVRERLPDGSFHIRFTAVAAQLYKIEASEALSSWTDLGAAQDLGGGSFEFTDGNTSLARRFYRVKGP